jgi:hypothetical protein
MTITPTAVAASLPAGIRPKRHEAGGANRFFGLLDRYSNNSDVRTLALGVLYADHSGRATGTVAMALRRATPWQASRLIAAMLADGITRQNEVGGWLNAKALGILGA